MAKEKAQSVQAGPALREPADEGVKPDPRDEAIAALREQLDRLERQMASNAVNAPAVVQEEKSRREQDEWKKELAKGTTGMTQDAADRRFPEGRHVFLCDLPDGNRHPTLSIRADNEVDAAARYLSVCGVRSAEKQVVVNRA